MTIVWMQGYHSKRTTLASTPTCSAKNHDGNMHNDSSISNSMYQYIKINNVILTCIQVLVNQTSYLESSQFYY